MILAKGIYQLITKLPIDNKFSLISKFKQCYISILSNIAEESRRNSRKNLFNYKVYQTVLQQNLKRNLF